VTGATTGKTTARIAAMTEAPASSKAATGATTGATTVRIAATTEAPASSTDAEE
jgi:hypothetical protein